MNWGEHGLVLLTEGTPHEIFLYQHLDHRCSAGSSVTRCDVQERDVLTGCHDAFRALARARSCADGSSELGFEERRRMSKC